MIDELLTLAAVLSCTFFSGAALYVSLVEHPARLSCGIELAAKQWKPSYERATKMQASLALIATAAAAALWVRGAGLLWLVVGGIIFSVVPFTLIVIRPTNERLAHPSRDLSSSETGALLQKWGRLHAVRSGLGLVASVVCVSAVGP